jgi:hypothetical protein
MVEHRGRMDELMRARHAEGLWVSDEPVEVLRSVSASPVLQDSAGASRAIRLAHYRAGELFAEDVEIVGK